MLWQSNFNLSMIKTPRLTLLPFTEDHYQAIFKEDYERLASLLQVKPMKTWTEFEGAREAIHALHGFYHSLMGDLSWGSYFIIHTQQSELIGTCGFKGKPGEDNAVEIGYEINPRYQGQGFATEAARALTGFAFSRQIGTVLAHTLPNENPSTGVLKKCGFAFVKEVIDPDDGPVWQWMLPHP